MRRQSALVLAVFVMVTALAVVVIWTQIAPEYRAAAEVRVRPVIPRLVFQTEDNGAVPFYGAFVNTQASIIRSMTVLQRVLDQQDVRETQWYRNSSKSLGQKRARGTNPRIERLRGRLSVLPRPQTEIVDVSFVGRDADDARLIVDAVLDQYMRYVGERSNATEDQLYRQLVDQYRSLETEIQGREKVCAQLCRSLGTDTPQDVVSGKRARLDETQANLSRLRRSIDLLEWEMEQVATDDDGTVPVASTGTTERQPRYHEDPEWRKLDIDVRTCRHTVATSRLDANDPGTAQLKGDLAFAQELLRVREAQLDEQWLDQQKNAARQAVAGADSEGGARSLARQLARARHEEQFMQAELQKQQAELKQLFEVAQLLDKEDRALRHKRALLDAVRQRLDQKNMERNVPGSIEVLTRAYTPSESYHDRRIAFTAVTLVVGLGMGGCAASLRRKTRTARPAQRSKEDERKAPA